MSIQSACFSPFYKGPHPDTDATNNATTQFISFQNVL
jgi:hypothetical protein